MAKRVRTQAGSDLAAENRRLRLEVDMLRMQVSFERLHADAADVKADEVRRLKAEVRGLRSEVRGLKADAVRLKNQTTLQETISFLKFKYAAVKEALGTVLGEQYVAELDRTLTEEWLAS